MLVDNMQYKDKLIKSLKTNIGEDRMMRKRILVNEDRDRNTNTRKNESVDAEYDTLHNVSTTKHKNNNSFVYNKSNMYSQFKTNVERKKSGIYYYLII